MHELAVAHEILTLVQQHVPPDRAAQARAVRVRVGDLSGIVGPSLEFCFDAIVAGTPWKDARLVVERVPARAGCLDCGAVGETAGLGAGCPRCGGTTLRLVAGQELHVDAVDLDDDGDAAPSPAAGSREVVPA